MTTSRTRHWTCRRSADAPHPIIRIPISPPTFPRHRIGDRVTALSADIALLIYEPGAELNGVTGAVTTTTEGVLNRQIEAGGGCHRHPGRIRGQGLQHWGLDVTAVGSVVFGDKVGRDTDVVGGPEAGGEFVDHHGVFGVAVDDDGGGIGRQVVAGDHFHGRRGAASVAGGITHREGDGGGAHGEYAQRVVADSTGELTVVVVRGRGAGEEDLDGRIRGRGAAGISGNDSDAGRRRDHRRRGIDNPGINCR